MLYHNHNSYVVQKGSLLVQKAFFCFPWRMIFLAVQYAAVVWGHPPVLEGGSIRKQAVLYICKYIHIYVNIYIYICFSKTELYKVMWWFHWSLLTHSTVHFPAYRAHSNKNSQHNNKFQFNASTLRGLPLRKKRSAVSSSSFKAQRSFAGISLVWLDLKNTEATVFSSFHAA